MLKFHEERVKGLLCSLMHFVLFGGSVPSDYVFSGYNTSHTSKLGSNGLEGKRAGVVSGVQSFLSVL